MPSERIQRQIDAALDEVEQAVRERDWVQVREICDTVLRLDPANEDARAFLEAAHRDTGVGEQSAEPTSTEVERHFEATPTSATPPHPERFAGDRYEVRRHLGDGGTKRVFLVRDTRFDREVALALVRTEGHERGCADNDETGGAVADESACRRRKEPTNEA